jgi:hypothetical protein
MPDPHWAAKPENRSEALINGERLPLERAA